MRNPFLPGRSGHQMPSENYNFDYAYAPVTRLHIRENARGNETGKSKCKNRMAEKEIAAI